MNLPMPPTTLVGSYSQPDWLIDRARLGDRLPARVRAREHWRIPPEQLEEAQDDATVLAVRDQERAGIDILTDGEMRRESYSDRFANALSGVDLDHPGTAIDRTGKRVPVPRVTGPIKRERSVESVYIPFLRAQADRPLKITLPGPFTMAQQTQNEYYPEILLALPSKTILLGVLDLRGANTETSGKLKSMVGRRDLVRAELASAQSKRSSLS